ncbi:MAG: hypothetical protein AAF289_12110 [Cyanobacteria bacterium P01_A01_bin.135]
MTRIAKVAIALVTTMAGVSGLSSAAMAGEGGVAGGAAFTIDGRDVTGVAVSASVGKEAATAGAFNYAAGSDVANSAFAIGTAGTTALGAVGDPATFSVTTVEDTDRATPQANGFTNGFDIRLGTDDFDDLVTAP